MTAGILSAANSYQVHNLVSDLANTADHTDPNLLNPWGIAFSATSPFWISNNHSGTSTLYDGGGNAIPLVVQIPSPSGSTPGAPTGAIFNTTQSFAVTAGNPAAFLFCTEDGTIIGWNSTVDRTNGKILADNSASNAIYKGCALGGTADAPLLYATDFHNGKVDVWDGNFNPVQNANAFVDPNIPAGFAPFNIAVLNGKLYVTYAKQDDDKEDDVAGVGNGYIDVFDMSGGSLTRLITQGSLNSPWGLAIAPAGFGDFAGDLLVGNFGDGMIHAFNPDTGALIGTMYQAVASGGNQNQPVVIQGLWGLAFGNGGKGGDPATLYFTAGSPGPNGEPLESHGLFGSIQAAPTVQASGVENGASFDSTIAANSWVSIFAGGLSGVTRSWETSDFTNVQLPTELSGVTVTVNGEPAYLSYVSPMQINLLMPTDIAAGPAQIVVTNGLLSSPAVTVTVESVAPAFFLFSGTKYIAATHSDNVSLTGPPNLISGVTTTPAQIGETVVLYGTGFGATNPPVPNGQLITTAYPLAVTPTVTIGGVAAHVAFAGVTAPGLYQLNVVVPEGVPAGDAAVVVQVPGGQSQANAFLSIGATAAP
ncbi:MAG TPA: TIGR03118 family protein [Bryobacteraceae bacterium]|nr:TIGR03118 family protein [Bryobacteraceae bacterium]